MRRAALLWVMVLALLTGCVGIPTSGGVEAGPPIDGDAQPDLDFVARGPVADSDQERILTDFMLAVRSSKNDYAVARQFLTPELAARWKPNARTVVRTTASQAPSGAGSNIWLYSVTTSATVNADGRYAEAPGAPMQTLEFAFEQVDGQWRISEAADGIVLSQASFDVAFRQQALYFFDASHQFLVPDVRWFPSTATAPRRAVRALLDGPAEWLQQGVLQTAFPVATALGDDTVDIAGNTAVVDLSVEALASTPQERSWMRQQLAATLGVPNVTLTVAGRDLPTPEPSGDAAAVDPQVDPAALVRTGDGFGFDGGAGIAALDGLSDAVVAVDATAAVLSADNQVIAFRGGDGAVGVVTTTTNPLPVDQRAGLSTPSLDPFAFVWSVQSGSAASLRVFDIEGVDQGFVSGLPADSAVVAMDVSRDGTRLLLYLAAPGGPRLAVAGIIRQDTVPVSLGPLEDLPVGAQTPVDAAWVDDRTVATLDGDGEVTAVELGGPSVSLGIAPGGNTLVGGNNGSDGLRVLADGEVLRPQGSGWVGTGILASLLATKQ